MQAIHMDENTEILMAMSERTGRTPVEVDRAWRLAKLQRDIQLVNAGIEKNIQKNQPPLGQLIRGIYG